MRNRTRREFLVETGAGGGYLAAGGLWVGLAPGPQEPPAAGLVAHWPLESVEEGAVRETVGAATDAIHGHFRVTGAAGLKFDGQSTRIVRAAGAAPELGPDFTVAAWVALGAYPWNWCAVAARQRGEAAGWHLGIGPRGEPGLHLRVDGEWRACMAPDATLDLRRWVHLAATVRAGGEAVLYVDGAEVSRLTLGGAPRHADDADLVIGMSPEPSLPGLIVREEGSRPDHWVLDGRIRDLRLYDRPLTAAEASALAAATAPAPDPDLPQHRLPSGPEGPGRFGAYTCRLRWDPDWEAHWPVGPDTDVVVRFDRSGARVVFWRGTRYSPAWVSENGLWMADQSVETWDPATHEHMNDFHCRYSHVRVLESHPARVVVHWRYAPVDVGDEIWNPDPITGWGLWVDEVYTIYPDVAGTRTVYWRPEALGEPHQFQESIPFCHPGQVRRDVIHEDYCTVANLAGETGTLRYVPDPVSERTDLPDDLVLQNHNFRSRWKPFIVFEPGNEWHYLRDMDVGRLDRPGSMVHWPVGQARSDGRGSVAADRPTSFLGFPISRPVRHHDDDGRDYWTGLYGMTDRPVEDLVTLARAWNRPPECRVRGDGWRSSGFDRRERAWQLERQGEGSGTADVELVGSSRSPVRAPALVLLGWGDVPARVRVDGAATEVDVRVGHRHRLERSDLIVWTDLEATRPVRLRIEAEERT